ncbi:hypothetical protein [Stutzerimonas stutzeri]|jgi:hypothetical protein|uniref:Uncharacterized protein n=1 Tax=Stutzerimonas stutzeri TaxID=316 RepID=A0A5S5B8W8_STUST|nr:hypothetical protein [Stutzerimonas stutzeri]MBK60570.1 hypothetical protein [Pseudomonas sp.]TYP63359.1 hypothetical protein A9A72_123127 [Stutzerimonas stutzeri]|tara:strand:+ start:111 stop:419 length:309 start_codon:yes stop_codon:yes gene_type:complete
MRSLLLGLALLAPAAQAGVLINSPYWVVALTCSNNQECYAASNGSYTGSLNGARRFNDQTQATKFLNSLTSSLRDKSPRMEQHTEQQCVEPSGSRPYQGRPC